MNLRITTSLSATILCAAFSFGQQTTGANPFDAAPSHPSDPPGQSSPQDSPASRASASPNHKLGPLEVSVNGRTRPEGCNWFQSNTGNSDYGLWSSLLRVGISETGERVDWFVEAEQPSILGLPNNAGVAAPQVHSD